MNKPVNSISMQGNIIDVKPHSSQILFSHDSLLGRPLESSDYRVLDFIQVLHSLRAVDQDVGSSALGTEAPDFTGLSEVILVLLAQVTGTGLEVVTWVYAALEL